MSELAEIDDDDDRIQTLKRAFTRSYHQRARAGESWDSILFGTLSAAMAEFKRDIAQRFEAQDAKIIDLKHENADLKGEIIDLKHENADLKGEIAELKSERAEERAEVKSEIARIKEIDDRGPWRDGRRYERGNFVCFQG